MKNTFKYLLGTLALAGTMVACSPEEFDHLSEAGIVNASSFDSQVSINVDQSTNQVNLSLSGAKQVYPVWEIDLGKGKKDISTNPSYSRIISTMGDYTVRCYVGNRNGISSDYIEKTIHINNSIVDFSKYTTMLSKAPWYVDNTAKGHLACGEPGTDGTNWWSAGPDEKAAFGVYDNCLTFTSDMKYTFDPGAAGTLYANWAVTSNNWQATYWSGVENEDFNVPVEIQNSTYNFEVDGEDLYLTFPKGTYFPYIANDDIWNTPRYLVVNMTTKSMTLRSDNGGIAWQYILTTQHEVKEVFNGFDVNSADNLWKQANPTFGSQYYAHGGSWEALPEYEHSEENGVFTVKLPTASDNQWQAQYCLQTDLNSSIIVPGTTYDFSCKITSSTDLPGVTLKLTSQSDDPSLINNQNGPLAVIPAMEETIVYFTELEAPAIEGNYKFVFDFGGNPDNSEITISDIVIIEHSKNKISAPTDGGDTPGDKPAEAVKDWNSAAASNLWNAVESGDAFISVTPWFSPSNWSGGLTPEWSHEGNVWSVTMPEGMGGDQWMGQFPINTTLAAKMGKKYNFYCVLEADNDCKGVTIKLTESDDAEKHDNNFFFADRHDVTAFTEFVYKAENVELPLNDAHALSLFFDFGGTPVGTTVKISEIYFEEVVSVDYTDENNLWKAVDGGDAFISVTPWFSPSNWSGGLTPEWSHEGNVWSVTMPEGMGGDQWMGQFPINTTLSAAQADTYNFSCTLEADNDCKGVTIKLTQSDEADGTKHDDNFFFADRHDVAAFEPFVYTVKNVQLPKNDAHALSLFFDFGGTPVGTNVKISNITLIKN